MVHLDQGPPGAELQAYLQAKAMKAATVKLPSIREDSPSPGKHFCNFDICVGSYLFPSFWKAQL